ncbi:MAG TPA: hypothetical protein VN873_04690 [Candidatus Angelobacter sp.]|nr:hypothetical protein [Candidatus Angelobacter sp.]
MNLSTQATAPRDVVTLKTNFLAPTVRDLGQFLQDFAAWAYDENRDPEKEPKPKTASAPDANTYRFTCDLSTNGRDMRATLLSIINRFMFRDAAEGRDQDGSWSYSKATPAPVRHTAPTPQWFSWSEGCHFESNEAVIAALEQAAQDVLTANIDTAGGYGCFTGFAKLPNAGGYRFTCNITFGAKERCAQFMREVAKQIAAGETLGNLNHERWQLTLSDSFEPVGETPGGGNAAAPSPEASAPSAETVSAPAPAAASEAPAPVESKTPTRPKHTPAIGRSQASRNTEAAEN